MKIIKNPNSGRSYSSARARLLTLIAEILSPNLTRAFFANSRAEANNAAIKLARKHGRRTDIISMDLSFHGRTIGAASATGQAKRREWYYPTSARFQLSFKGYLAGVKELYQENGSLRIVDDIQTGFYRTGPVFVYRRLRR